MLESNRPLALLGFDKSGKVIALKATTAQSVAALEKLQTLGYLRQDLLSEEALTWPLDTIRDCMSEMKKPNLRSP